MQKLIYLLIIMVFSVNILFSQNWTNIGEGLEGNIYDLISFEGNLYAGGRLGVSRRGVFYWDGNNWNNTNNLYGISTPLTLEIYAQELYTSGDFHNSSNSTRVFKWENGDWVQQGDSFGGATQNSVKKLKKYGNHLYAGGQFELIGNLETKNIARWDGQNWENIGNGIPGLIIGMDSFQDKLVVNHSQVDTIKINDSTTQHVPRLKLQMLQDDIWIDLDSVFDHKSIHLLGVINNELYFGSNDSINGISIEKIGIWDGMSITSIGDSLFSSVNHVHEYNNEVYASCITSVSNPVSNIYSIKKQVNEGWITVGGTFDDYVLASQNHNGNLFVGGFFNKYENDEMKHVSKLGHSTNIRQIEEISTIQFFPNPTHSQVTIVNKNNHLIKIQLFSNDGRLLKEWEKINQCEFTINIDEFPKGLYLLKSLLNDGRTFAKKIIKD